MARKPVKRNDEAPLDGLRTVLKTQAVTLSLGINQISNPPPTDP